jgi:hypothetical protein
MTQIKDNKLLKVIFAEAKSQPVSFVGSIASIIAIINTIYAAPSIIYGYEHSPISININLALIACLFFLLEGSLASVFSRLYVWIANFGSGFPLMLMCVNAIVSAGVTGYNCVWMFTDTVESHNRTSAFTLAMFVGWFISVYFLYFHCQLGKKLENLQPDNDAAKIEGKYTSHYWSSFFLNLFAFIFTYVNLVGDV